MTASRERSYPSAVNSTVLGARVPRPLTHLADLDVSAEDLLAVVLETAAQPLWIVDPDDVIRFASRPAIAALGYDREDDLLGRGGHETVHPRHADPTACPAGECPMLLPLATGETVRSELDWVLPARRLDVPRLLCL